MAQTVTTSHIYEWSFPSRSLCRSIDDYRPVQNSIFYPIMLMWSSIAWLPTQILIGYNNYEARWGAYVPKRNTEHVTRLVAFLTPVGRVMNACGFRYSKY